MNNEVKYWKVERKDGGAFAYSHVALWHNRYFGLYHNSDTWSNINVHATRTLLMHEVKGDKLPSGPWINNFIKPEKKKIESNLVKTQRQRVNQDRRNEFEKIMADPNSVENVIKKEFEDRAKHGYVKYGVGIMRQDINILGWIQHAKEEAMDWIVYLERLKREIQDKHPELIEQVQTPNK